MICHGFKGGIGTASRTTERGYVVGVLVQANHGRRERLRVNGRPVEADDIPTPAETGGAGSIIGIAATDAPLLPHQCRRLAQRIGLGVARMGGGGEQTSGDLFLAFSTGNTRAADRRARRAAGAGQRRLDARGRVHHRALRRGDRRDRRRDPRRPAPRRDDDRLRRRSSPTRFLRTACETRVRLQRHARPRRRCRRGVRRGRGDGLRPHRDLGFPRALPRAVGDARRRRIGDAHSRDRPVGDEPALAAPGGHRRRRGERRRPRARAASTSGSAPAARAPGTSATAPRRSRSWRRTSTRCAGSWRTATPSGKAGRRGSSGRSAGSRSFSRRTARSRFASPAGSRTASSPVSASRPRSSTAVSSTSPKARARPAAIRTTCRSGSRASGSPEVGPEDATWAATAFALHFARSGVEGKFVPDEHRDAVVELGRAYDLISHGAVTDAEKREYAELAERLGIADYLRSRFVFSGTPDEVEAQIRAAMDAGASRFDGAIDADLPEHRERIEQWAKLVLPRLRSRRLDGGDPGAEVPALPAPERDT